MQKLSIAIQLTLVKQNKQYNPLRIQQEARKETQKQIEK